MNSIISHVKANIGTSDASVIITERSVLSSQYVFAKNLLQNGEMVKEDYEILSAILDSFDIMYKPNVIIYIRTSPEKCMQRISKRSREGEHNIDLQYITNLHLIHEEWIQSMTEEVSKQATLLPTFSTTYPFLRILRRPLTLDNDNDGVECTEVICNSIMEYVGNLLIEDYNDETNV